MSISTKTKHLKLDSVVALSFHHNDSFCVLAVFYLHQFADTEVLEFFDLIEHLKWKEKNIKKKTINTQREKNTRTPIDFNERMSQRLIQHSFHNWSTADIR